MTDFVPTHLFVYGTLRNSRPNAIAATITGTLVSLGAFPAVTLDGDTKIQGEIFPVDPLGLLNYDRYEGVAHGLYKRELVMANTDAGPVPAYVYVAGPLLTHEIAGLDPIQSGDWFVR